jgi:hypothetical protein
VLLRVSLAILISVELFEFFGELCGFCRRATVGNHRARMMMFALFADQNTLGSRFQSHDRGELAQEQFARRDGFGEAKR